MRTSHLLIAAAIGVAVVAAWVGPALRPTDAVDEGCEARGLAWASCSFTCIEGQRLVVSVEVEWGWLLSKASGTATCGEDVSTCETGSSFCRGAVVAAAADDGVRAGPGACAANKIIPFTPGAVRVRCWTETG